MEERLQQECGQCGKLSETKCARCKMIYYCSKDCQKNNWKKHKKVCKYMEKERLEDEEVDDNEILSTNDMILKVKVAKSTVHGSGVFVTKDISQGERICFFDGELKDANTSVRIRRLPQGELSIIDSEKVFQDASKKGKK